MELKSRLGYINPEYSFIKLKDVLVRDNSGEWGDDPDKEFISVIRGTNFNNDGKLDISDIALRYLTPEQIEKKKLYENDIIVERSGGSDSQPVGRVGFVDKRIAAINCSCANFIQRISLNDSVNSKYVFYCLQQLYEMKQTTAMQAQTTGLRNLDWKMYKKTILPNPELQEQKAIAGVISKVDQCIEDVQKTMDATQKLKKSLMQNLLTGRMKPDGTIRKDDEFYEHPKMGKVPIGWETRKLKDLFVIRAGGDLKENYYSPIKTEKECYPIFANSLSNKGLYGYTSKPFFPENTLTITGRGELGHVEYRNTAYDAIVRLNVLIPKEGSDIYVKFFEPLISQTVKFVNESTGVPQLTAPAIRVKYISYPKDAKEQEYISNIFDLLDEKIKSIIQKKENLYRLKKSLMQNLLTGKKRVNVAKINSLLEKME